MTFLALLGLHAGALAVFLPHTFSWTALAVAITLFYATGALGVCLGFHRILTHRSMSCPKWLEYALAFLGALAVQGGPIDWVATHRAHHAHTDREGDPHDVHRGLRWAHFQWLYRHNEAKPAESEWPRLAPDLIGDRFYMLLERTYALWQVALGLVLFALGGWPWVVWGIFVRLVATYHVSWLVNSAAHHSGYRSFRTGDESRNNWLVGLLAWGEGWHNNHHAFPFSARHGLRWFEFDAVWIVIKALHALRLVHDVKLPSKAMLARLAIEPTPKRAA